MVARLAVRLGATPLKGVFLRTLLPIELKKLVASLSNVRPPTASWSGNCCFCDLFGCRESSQDRLESGLKVLSLSSADGAVAPSVGAREEAGKEAPLDSLLASAAEVGGLSKSSAHQVCLLLMFTAVGGGSTVFVVQQSRRLKCCGCAHVRS